ncbi:DNA helicase II [Corynebacterium sp. 13CS0277]|uniref:UvrD-helicase domain-containing protein n=1 Tax=Corynebacterium sp. 13CS0277 TaxID=2071994 RepID=UPI000D03943F|nr:UvrD-helicase domain-containing protein [Corynebacterium sp. 13CS0277]PRQ11458.1 DNA helicase II [Corynebacterium sp. 13CS0277]
MLNTPDPTQQAAREPFVSAEELSRWLRQPFPPTAQQAAVITAPAEPLLVVAGAGAGKTETMAARVVWLVANRFVDADAVLGLTFTRKAAQELGLRIRHRLKALSQAPELPLIDDDGQLARSLATANPTVLTYDSYAGRLVREYGLLLPVEPSARLISTTELFLITRDVVSSLRGELHLADNYGLKNIVRQVMDLNNELDNHLIGTDVVREETTAFLAELQSLPPSKRAKNPEGITKDTRDAMDAQQRRLALLPAVDALRAELRRRNVMTFSEQMSVAARVARLRPEVRESQRARFRAVMLDEYQDTSAAQRILLSNLFGDPHPSTPVTSSTQPAADERELSSVARGIAVTAVGDPMQAIYSWRGATASNLLEFVRDFPRVVADTPAGADGEQAPVLRLEGAEMRELTTSWRNPPEVLELANDATVGQLGALDSSSRIVSPLQPRAGAPSGTVILGRYATAAEEIDAVADMLAEDFYARRAEGKEFTGAVLVRKNAQTAPMAAALAARDIPFEIVGLKGLLDVPEVADTLAIARMLIHPQDDVASLRILLGPHVGLGLSDLRALGVRARNLAGRVNRRNVTTVTDEDAAAAQPMPEDARTVADAEEKLGLRLDAPDLQAHILDLLHARSARATDEDTSESPEQPLDAAACETFARELAGLLDQSDDTTVGLADAVADLGERERYSEEGYRRLSVLASELRELRTNSLGGSLTDLINDIDSVVGLRSEVLAREDTRSRARVGTAHLDKLAEEVANYARIPGASLAGMLDYFDLARAHDLGLERGDVAVSGDRVQLLTVHKAKGLEWGTVAVIGATSRVYGIKGVSTWVTTPGMMPTALRSDADGGVAHRFGAPVLDTSEVDTQQALSAAVKAFKQELSSNELGEVERLFYVALTRAERTLIVTSAAANGGQKEDPPFSVLQALMQAHPELVRDTTGAFACATGDTAPVAADGPSPATATTPAADAPAGFYASVEVPEGSLPFPREFLGARAVGVHRAAERTRAEYARLAAEQHSAQDADSTDTTDSAAGPALWARDVDAIIEEARRAETPEVTVRIGDELTASDVISLRKDPEEFAKRRRRPRPFKPNAYAKRGTALHQWIEDYYGATSLLDDDELPGMGEEDVTPAQLKELKEKFLASSWADRQPVAVEYPFTVSLGGKMVTGRIDAIFHSGDDITRGWQVVDWKSGVPPKGKELQDAAIQLAVYRYALAQLLKSITRDDLAGSTHVAAHHGGRLTEALRDIMARTQASTRELRDIDLADIDAGFYYIGFDHFVVPRHLPDIEELSKLVTARQ